MCKPQKQLRLIVQCDSEKQASIISSSVCPEIYDDSKDVKINLIQQKNEVVIEFSAVHTNMLRASLNSYLRWIETAYNVSSLKL